MSRGRLLLTAALVAAYSLVAGSPVHAQAVTTGTVSGLVTTESGEAVANAQVQVINRSTGFTAGVTTGASGVDVIDAIYIAAVKKFSRADEAEGQPLVKGDVGPPKLGELVRRVG